MGSFSSDLTSLVPDVLWAKGAGLIASRANSLRRASMVEKAGGVLDASQGAKLLAFEQSLSKSTVALASGYSAATRTMNSAMAQGFDYTDSVMLSFRQLVITGVVTGMGSGSGVESWATGIKGDAKRFWKDYIAKDVIGEGIEEAIDEMVSGIVVEMDMNPDMSVHDAVDAGTHAFFLGAAMGGGVNALSSLKKAPEQDASGPSSVADLSLTNLDLTGGQPSPPPIGGDGGPGASGPIGDPGPVGDSDGDPTGSASDTSTSTSTAASTKGLPGDSAPTITPPPPVASSTTKDRVEPIDSLEESGVDEPGVQELGGGVSLDTSEGAKSPAEQVFGDGLPKGQVVTGKVSSNDLKVKSGKGGVKRLHVKGVPTDRIYDDKKKRFKTEKNSKAPQKTADFLGTEALQPKAEKITPAKKSTKSKQGDSKSDEKSPPSARIINAGPEENRAKRAKLVSDSKSGQSSAAELDSLEGEDSTVEFSGVKSGGIYNSKTGNVEINPEASSRETLTQRTIPRVTAEKAALTSPSKFEEVAAALDSETVDKFVEGRTASTSNEDSTEDRDPLTSEQKAKLFVASAITGTAKQRAAATKAIAEILEDGDVAIESQIRTLLEDIEAEQAGPGTKSIIAGRIEELRNKLNRKEVPAVEAKEGEKASPKVSAIDLGAPRLKSRPLEVEQAGVTRTTSVVFNALRQDSGGENSKIAEIDSSTTGEANRLDKNLQAGSSIEVAQPNGKTQRWVVMKHHRRPDGSVRHELRKVSDSKTDTEMSKIYNTPEGREAITNALLKLSKDSTEAEARQLIRDTITDLLENIAGKGFTKDRLKFVSGVGGRFSVYRDTSNRLAWAKLDEAQPSDENSTSSIYINEDKVLEYFRSFINPDETSATYNSVAAKAKADDIAIYFNQVLFEEVAHTQALDQIKPEDVVSMMRDWISLSKEDEGARAELLRWHAYQQGNPNASIAEKKELWERIVELSDSDSDQSEVELDQLSFAIGHEALAGFLQLIKTGNTTIDMESNLYRWLNIWSSDPGFNTERDANKRRGRSKGKISKEETKSDESFTLFRRLTEMASRMVQSVRNYFDAHRKLNSLPESLTDLVNQLDIIVSSNPDINVPNPFGVQAKAMEQAANNVDQTRKFLAGNFDLLKEQQALRGSLERIGSKIGTKPAQIISLSWNSDGTASLKVNPEMELLIEEDEADTLNAALGEINDSGRPTIIAQNAADNADIQLVLRRLNLQDGSLDISTREGRSSLTDKAFLYAENQISETLGVSDVQGVISKLSDFYTEWTKDDLGRKIVEMQKSIPDPDLYMYASLPEEDGSPEIARKLRALEKSGDIDAYQALVDEMLTDEKSDAYNSKIGDAFKTQQQRILDLGEDVADLIKATRIYSFRSLDQFLDTFHAEQMLGYGGGAVVNKDGSGRFDAAMKSTFFDEAFPGVDVPKAMRAFEEASNVMRTAKGMAHAAREMEFALIGGRPPARIVRDNLGNEVQSFEASSINLDRSSNKDPEVYFGLAKALRSGVGSFSADTDFTNIDDIKKVATASLNQRLGSAEDAKKAKKIERIAELSSELSNKELSTPEKIDELIKLTNEVRADIDLKVVFLDSSRKRVGVSFNETIPTNVQKAILGEEGVNEAGFLLTQAESAAYVLLGLDINALNRDRRAIPRAKLKSMWMTNALIHAREITTQSIIRDFRADSLLLNTDFLSTGGFPIAKEEGVFIGRDQDGNKLYKEATVFDDQWFEVSDLPEGFIDKDLGFDSNNSLKVLAESGELANFVLNIARKIDLMESETSLDTTDPILNHQYGLTPAGLVYQMTASPLTALLARIKKQKIKVALKDFITEEISLLDYMIEQYSPGDSNAKHELESLFAGLAPGIENASVFEGDKETDSLFFSFIDFRRQVNAANLVYSETIKTLRNSRTIREIQRRAATSGYRAGGDLTLAVNEKIMSSLAHEGQVLRDASIAQGRVEGDRDLLSIIRPDKAIRLLNRFHSAMKEVDPVVYMTPSWDTSPTENTAPDFLITAGRRTGERAHNMRADTQEEMAGAEAGQFTSDEERNLQQQQNAVNNLANIRTVALMEIHGRNPSLVRRILASPEYSTMVKSEDGSISIDYNYEKIDSDLMSTLERFADEERAIGHVYDITPVSKEGDSKLVVDLRLQAMLEEFGGIPEVGSQQFAEQDLESKPERHLPTRVATWLLRPSVVAPPEATPEALAINSVLFNGGKVYESFSPDTDLDPNESKNSEFRHDSEKFTILEELMSQIPGIRHIQGNATFDAADSVPSIVFVPSEDAPVVITPMRSSKMVTSFEIEKTIQSLMVYMAKQNGADLVGIANSILQPIADLSSGKSFGRLSQSVKNQVMSYAARPKNDEQGGLGRPLTPKEIEKLDDNVSGLQKFAQFLGRKYGNASKDSLWGDISLIQGRIDNMNSDELAAEAITSFLTSQPLQRLLSIASTGLDVNTDPNSHLWIKNQDNVGGSADYNHHTMGSIIRPGLLVTEDGSTLPSFIKELTADTGFLASEVVDNIDDEMIDDILGGMSSTYLEALEDERSLIENDESKILRNAFSSNVAGSLGFADGQEQANKLLVNALINISVRPESPAKGLVPYPQKGGLTEFEAAQMIPLFTSEQLADMNPDIPELAVSAQTSFSIPDLMKWSETAANTIRERYENLIQSREGQSYSASARWGHPSGSDHLSSRSVHSRKMIENRMESGRYFAAQAMGLDEAGDQQIFSARGMDVESLKLRLIEAGLPTTIENPNSRLSKNYSRLKEQILENNLDSELPSTSAAIQSDFYKEANSIYRKRLIKAGIKPDTKVDDLSDVTIDFVQREWDDMKETDRYYREISDAIDKRIFESSSRSENLNEMLSFLKSAESELVNASSHEEFWKLVGSAPVWNVLQKNENAKKVFDRVFKTFFSGSDGLMSTLADELIAQDSKSILKPLGLQVGSIASPEQAKDSGLPLGTISLSQLIEKQGTPWFAKKKEVIYNQFSEFRKGYHGRSPAELAKFMRLSLRQLNTAEEVHRNDPSPDKKAEIDRQKRLLLEIATHINKWIEKSTAAVDAEFGENTISITTRYRNTPIVSLPGFTSGFDADFGPLRQSLETRNFEETVEVYSQHLLSLAEPKSMLNAIQQNALSESIRDFVKIKKDVNRRDIGDVQSTISRLSESEAAVAEAGEMGIDLSEVKNLRSILRDTRGLPYARRAQAITDALEEHLEQSFKPTLTGLSQGLEEELSKIPKEFIGYEEGQVSKIRDFLEGVKFPDLSPAESKRAAISVLVSAVKGQLDTQSTDMTNLIREKAARVRDKRSYSPGISTFRDNEHRGVKISGTPTEVELSHRVLTQIAKIHSPLYKQSLDEINDLEGLERVSEATRLADEKLPAMEAARKAFEGATGKAYTIVDEVFAPIDHRQRIADIITRNGGTPSERNVDDAVKGMSLFASVGYLDDRSDFSKGPSRAKKTSTPPKNETDKQKASREKKEAELRKKAADAHYNMHAISAEESIARITSDEGLMYGDMDQSMKEHGESIFGSDMMGEVKKLHSAMFAYVTLFKEYLDSKEIDFMGTDPEVTKRVDSLKKRVNDFTRRTGADVQIAYQNALSEYKRNGSVGKAPVKGKQPTVGRAAISELLSIYVDAKALKTSRAHAKTLEAGFVDASLLSGGLMEAMSHHDGKIRDLFARTVDGQAIAQGISGVLEYGPATGGSVKFGRAGYFRMKEAVNAALAKAAPKRKKLSKKSTGTTGEAVGVLEEIDKEKASEAYFLQSILSKIDPKNERRKYTSQTASAAATEILAALEANQKSLNAIEARSKVSGGLGAAELVASGYRKVKNKLFHTNPKLLEDRALYDKLHARYVPYLKEIEASTGSEVAEITTRMQNESENEYGDQSVLDYAKFLDKTFKYYGSIYQAQSQLIPKQELLDEDNPNDWAKGKGNNYLLSKPPVPFRWQRAYTYDHRLGGNDFKMSDAVSMRGSTWLRGLKSGIDTGDLQILDIDGLRAPSSILDDMAFRMNVAPAFDLVQAITGVSKSVLQGGVSSGSLQMESDPNLHGALFGYSRGNKNQPEYGRERTKEARLEDIALGLSYITQEIVANDISRQAPNSYVQDIVEELQVVGMGTALISAKQLLAQTLPGMALYSTVYGGLGKNIGVWPIFLRQSAGMLASKIPFYNKGDHSQDYVSRVNSFIKKQSFSLYLRNAEGIEMFMNDSKSSRLLLKNRKTITQSDSSLNWAEVNVVNRLKGLAKATKDGMISGVQAGLKNTIAAAEKAAIHSIFINEVAKRVSELVGSDVTPDALINPEAPYDDYLSSGLLEQARIAAVDLLGQSDTSKKAKIFQRSGTISGEIGRTLFSTFATHLLSTSSNSKAGARMIRHGATKADKLAGARLISTNVGQNSLYHMMDFGLLSWVASHAIAAIAGWNDEERKEALLKFYDLDEGSKNRYGSNPMGYITHLVLGSQKPFGYDYYKGEWTNKRMGKDAQNLGIKVAMEFINQTPGLGLFTSTALGGTAAKDWFLTPRVEAATGISSSKGERRGISFGPPGKDGIKDKNSAINRVIYDMSMSFRNDLARSNYLFMGIDFLAQPFYHVTNSTQAEVSGDAWKYMIGGMIPPIPRETRREMWEKFDNAADSELWHNDKDNYDRYRRSRR